MSDKVKKTYSFKHCIEMFVIKEIMPVLVDVLMHHEGLKEYRLQPLNKQTLTLFPGPV